MKYIKLSVGFFLASLLQALTVAFGKQIGFSQFAIQFTPFQVVHHFLVGQILGYVIYSLFVSILKRRSILFDFIIGCAYGILAWAAIITIGLHSGVIHPQWLQFGGVVTTLVAFLIYGAISGLVASTGARHSSL